MAAFLSWWPRYAGDEGLEGRSSVHAAALVRPPGVTSDEVVVEHGLHLLDGLEPGLVALDAEVLAEQRAVQPFDNAVGLRPADLGVLVLDAFELQERLVGILVLAAAELAAVVAAKGILWAPRRSQRGNAISPCKPCGCGSA